MSQNRLSQRTSSLDLMKSLGLLLVIFYHITGTPDILSSGSVFNALGYFFYPFLSCCVPLFFMVSGALALIGAAKSYVKGSLSDTVFYNYSDPFTLILTASVFLLWQGVTLRSGLQKLTQSLATCSLGIYVTHWLFLEALRQFLPQLTDSAILALPVSVLVLLVSWVLCFCCLKIPLAKNLFTATPAWIKKYSQAA